VATATSAGSTRCRIFSVGQLAHRSCPAAGAVAEPDPGLPTRSAGLGELRAGHRKARGCAVRGVGRSRRHCGWCVVGPTGRRELDAGAEALNRRPVGVFLLESQRAVGLDHGAGVAQPGP
ncbi:MAG: hypothetical protein ACRDSF_15525, partial [Pseudonocardiaceae bacterium]